MNKTCPGCNTPYNVADTDVGRTFSCFKCNAPLVVRKDGIRLASTAGVSSEPDIAVSAPTAQAAPGGASNTWRRIADWFGDVSTWLFGIGAFLVIVFLFFPIINTTKVARAKAAIQALQLKDDRADREMKQKMQDKKDISVADEELRKKAHDSWVKQKGRMEDDLEELNLDTKQSDYGYTWGMMLGFLFLAAAALGYLTPRQPTIRRVVGAIVIVAEVLLIFLRYVLGKI